VIRVVIDTNVWVAGLLSRTGPPARVVDLSLAGIMVPVVGPHILREYERVLLHRDLGLSVPDVNAVMAYLKLPGSHVVHVDPIEPLRVCADPDDDIFIAAAVEGRAAALITGNLRHYPTSPWRGIVITSPAVFLKSMSLIE
jgi:putative PIN family toxin of toxin-antitoxin system